MFYDILKGLKCYDIKFMVYGDGITQSIAVLANKQKHKIIFDQRELSVAFLNYTNKTYDAYLYHKLH